MNDAGLYISNAPIWWRLDGVQQHPHMMQMLPALLAVASPEAWHKKPMNGVHLFGPFGRGKTSLGLALLYLWGKLGHSARFQDFDELMLRVRATWRKDAPATTEQVYAEMLVPKILMLDDIGKAGGPERVEALSTIINSRINRGRPTICTSNHDLNTKEGMAAFLVAVDVRVAERLRGCGFLIQGPNLRDKP